MSEMYCITCPTGCLLTVSADGKEIVVEGNECKRGVDFATAETTNPTRSLTTTVRTTFPDFPVLPVRTDGEIPKNKIMEAMRALSGVLINRPLECGDTVLGNVAGCGVRVIATGDMLKPEAVQAKKQDRRPAQDPPPILEDAGTGADTTEQAEAETSEETPQPAADLKPKTKQRARIG